MHKQAIEARFEPEQVAAAFEYDAQGTIIGLGPDLRSARYILELARTSERANLAALSEIKTLITAIHACVCGRRPGRRQSLKPPSET